MNFKPLMYLSFLSLLMFSCNPFHTKIEDEKITVVSYEAKNIVQPSTPDSLLNIVTWNIKFGGGRIDMFFDCHGDRVIMTHSEVMENMKGVAANIKHMNPDIIFLQEVDIDSKRSVYVDQVQYILDNTDLNYAVYASQWKADYIPSDGLGQMNSGNAILSKYPLDNAERIALPLIGEQSGLVQYFYLRRNVLVADVTIKDKKINLLGTHTSAYSTDGTKKIQLEKIKEKVAEIDSKGERFILGGDFNNLPPNTQKYCDFDDDVCEGEFATQPCDVFIEELPNMKIFSDSYDSLSLVLHSDIVYDNTITGILSF